MTTPTHECTVIGTRIRHAALPWLRRAGVAFAAGVLMGAFYWVLHVQSPAPVPVALAGLFGMVVGEHAAGLVLRHRRAHHPRHLTRRLAAQESDRDRAVSDAFTDR